MLLLKSRVPNQCGTMVDRAFHPSMVDKMNTVVTCRIMIEATSVHIVDLQPWFNPFIKGTL